MYKIEDQNKTLYILKSHNKTYDKYIYKCYQIINNYALFLFSMLFGQLNFKVKKIGPLITLGCLSVHYK